MRSLTLGLAAMLVLGLLAVGLGPGREGRAQTYPPPVGSLSVEAPTAAVGSTVDVTATVLDNSGNPVEGASVTFRIVSQPGDDASWADGGLETTALTNASGTATAVLSAGSSPGSIIVETISGEKTSQVTVAVEPEAGLPPTGGPPSESSDGGLPTYQIAALALATAAAIAGAAVLARRRRKA